MKSYQDGNCRDDLSAAPERGQRGSHTGVPSHRRLHRSPAELPEGDHVNDVRCCDTDSLQRRPFHFRTRMQTLVQIHV